MSNSNTLSRIIRGKSSDTLPRHSVIEDPLIKLESWFCGLFQKLVVIPSAPSLDYELSFEISRDPKTGTLLFGTRYFSRSLVSLSSLPSVESLTDQKVRTEFLDCDSIYSNVFQSTATIHKLESLMNLAQDEILYWNNEIDNSFLSNVDLEE
jgi:hypothetical protein